MKAAAMLAVHSPFDHLVRALRAAWHWFMRPYRELTEEEREELKTY